MRRGSHKRKYVQYQYYIYTKYYVPGGVRTQLISCRITVEAITVGCTTSELIFRDPNHTIDLNGNLLILSPVSHHGAHLTAVN